MSVASTLWRIRGRCARVAIRGPTTIAIPGRARTSPRVADHPVGQAAPPRRPRYSETVSVITSPTPRRSRSPDVAWWIAWSWRHRRNGREHEQARDPPQIAIRALGRQKRSVRAVVKDDERAHQKARGQDNQRQRERQRDAERPVDQCRTDQVRHHRGGELQHASPQTGLGVGRKRFRAGAAASLTRHGLAPVQGWTFQSATPPHAVSRPPRARALSSSQQAGRTYVVPPARQDAVELTRCGPREGQIHTPAVSGAMELARLTRPATVRPARARRSPAPARP